MPKFSSGYLTPQSHKQKNMSSKKLTDSTENVQLGFNISDDVFKKLMSDPVKRNLILNIITSEKDAIDAYKKTLEKKNASSPLHKALKKPCESPTQLLRRRALEQQRNAETSESESNSRPSSRQSVTSSTASTVPSPVMFKKILDGVVGYVEVRTGAKDRSDAVKALMTSMGAVVRDKFKTDITHVVFKEGYFSTYQRANLIKARLVSVLWVEACKNSGIRVPERNYPAFYTGGYDRNESVLCSQLQKDYEEVIQEEFENSIISGRPLPSATSVINRRRTLLTPNSQEVASITRRSLPGSKLNQEQYGDAVFSDDDSDLEPIINGEIIESGSQEFEHFGPTNKKNIHQQTNHQHEDMDLTDMQGEAYLFSAKTPKTRRNASECSNNESYDFIDKTLYRRRTDLIEEVTNKTDSRISQDKNSDRLTPLDSNDALASKHVHILSKNVSHKTPDVTKNNLEKHILSEKSIDDDNTTHVKRPLHQTSHKATETSNSTNMSSLRMSDNSNKSNNTSTKSNDKKTTNEAAEKSCNTNMSSLRVSDNSNKSNHKKSSDKDDNFKTTVTHFAKEDSFSSIESNVINSIIDQLHTSSDKENSQKSKSTARTRRSNIKNHDQSIGTPKSKLKEQEHITLRKKHSQPPALNTEDTELDLLYKEYVTQSLLLQSPQLTEDSADEEDQETKKSHKTKSISRSNKQNENINKENTNSLQTNSKNTKIKTITSCNSLADCSNHVENDTKKMENVRKPLARDLNKEFDETNGKQSKNYIKLRNNRHTIHTNGKQSNLNFDKLVKKDMSNRTKTAAESSSDVDQSSAEILKKPPAKEIGTRSSRRKTLAQIGDDRSSTESLMTSPEKEIETRSNKRKTIAQIGDDDRSFTEKLITSPEKEIKILSSKRKTIAQIGDNRSSTDSSVTSPEKEIGTRSNKRKILAQIGDHDQSSTERLITSPEKEIEARSNKRTIAHIGDNRSSTERLITSPEKETETRSSKRKTIAQKGDNRSSMESLISSPEKEIGTRSSKRKALAQIGDNRSSTESSITSTEKEIGTRSNKGKTIAQVRDDDRSSTERLITSSEKEIKTRSSKRKTIAQRGDNRSSTESLITSPEKEIGTRSNKRKAVTDLSSKLTTKQNTVALIGDDDAQSTTERLITSEKEIELQSRKRETLTESSSELKTGQNVVAQTGDDQSPIKKSKASPEKDSETRSSTSNRRRQTISSAVKSKPLNNKVIRRTLSSTDLNVTSRSGETSKKLRKLYSPNNFQHLVVSDETERNEKRRAKKRSDSGVFIKPIILSKKASEILSKNNLNIDSIVNPKQTDLEVKSKIDENRKREKENKEKNNSDDDEQVELKNELLKRKKTEAQKKGSTSRSSIFKPPETNNKTKNSAKSHVDSSQKSTEISKKRVPTPKKPATTPKKPTTTLKKPVITPKKPAITPKTPTSSTSQRKLDIKLTPIVSVRNRRSTMEFQAKAECARKKVKIGAREKPSIVCTKMHREEVQTFTQIVKKLGKFEVEDEVSDKTTHLVVGEPKRTINMLRAIIRGCWILKKEWLYRSLESRKWLPEEGFEETDFSPAVQKNRLYRQAFGFGYTMDIFRDCGPIYVTKGSIPRCSDLRELIHLCKGKTTKERRNASIIVGEYINNEGGKCVSEMWILDCLSSNTKLPFKKYLLNSKRKSVYV